MRRSLNNLRETRNPKEQLMSSNWKETVQRGLKKKRISARKLAQQAGLSITTIHNILNTEGFDPRISTLEKACGLLDINITFACSDDMSLEQLLHNILQKKWGAEVKAEQLAQLWNLTKDPAGKAVATKLLQQELYSKFSEVLSTLSLMD